MKNPYKKIVLASCLLFVVSSLEASYSLNTNFSKQKIESADILKGDYEKPVFVSIGLSATASEDKNVLGVQPIDEIVGSGGVATELRVGMSLIDKADRSEDGRVFIFLWGDPDKNAEIGFGLGGEIIGHFVESMPKLGFILGGQVGYGWQSVKGSSATISTSANKLSFVTGNVVMTPTTINYTADTAILNIGLNLGLTYAVLDHTSFDLVYSYNRSEYQAEYRTAQRSDILNNLTFNQDNHSMKFAINYRF